jgi:hypothetical protein
MYSAKIYSTELSSAKLNVPKSETEGSGISSGSDDLDETATAETDDWRTPLVCYFI